jgi:hypothetical protein
MNEVFSTATIALVAVLIVAISILEDEGASAAAVKDSFFNTYAVMAPSASRISLLCKLEPSSQHQLVQTV